MHPFEEEFKWPFVCVARQNVEVRSWDTRGNDALQVFYTRSMDPGTLLRYSSSCWDSSKDEDVSNERRNVKTSPTAIVTSLFRVVRRILVTSLKHCSVTVPLTVSLHNQELRFVLLIGVVECYENSDTNARTQVQRVYLDDSVRYFESTVWTNAC